MASRAINVLWSGPQRRITTGNPEGFLEHHSGFGSAGTQGRNGDGTGDRAEITAAKSQQGHLGALRTPPCW